MSRWPLLLIAALFMATTGFAGSSLSMRLVEASNSGSGVDAALDDVADALRGQLPFDSYRHVASGSTALPASDTTSLGGYSVTCNGPQNALAINVAHRGKVLVSTTVNLRDGKPLLLGGFPSGNGKMIVVFLAR